MMKGEGTGTGLPDRYLGGAAGRLVSEGMLNSDGEAFSISGLDYTKKRVARFWANFSLVWFPCSL